MNQQVYLQGERVTELEPHMTPDAAAVMWYLVQVCGGNIKWDSQNQRIDIRFPEAPRPDSMTERMMQWLGLVEESSRIDVHQGLFPPDGPLQPPPVELLSKLHRESLAASGVRSPDSARLTSLPQHPVFASGGVHQPQVAGNSAASDGSEEGPGQADSEEVEEKSESETADKDGGADEQDTSDEQAPEYEKVAQTVVQHRPLYPSRTTGGRESDIEIEVTHGQTRPNMLQGFNVSMLEQYHPQCDRSRNDE